MVLARRPATPGLRSRSLPVGKRASSVFPVVLVWRSVHSGGDQVGHGNLAEGLAVELNGERFAGPRGVTDDIRVAGGLSLAGWVRPDLDDRVGSLEPDDNIDRDTGRRVPPPFRAAIAV